METLTQMYDLLKDKAERRLAVILENESKPLENIDRTGIMCTEYYGFGTDSHGFPCIIDKNGHDYYIWGNVMNPEEVFSAIDDLWEKMK